MPESRSESETEELAFLSPDEEVTVLQDKQQEDQGASPALRRSNRKRKSVSILPEEMSKGSGSKKKKSSPKVPSPRQENPGKSMPRIPRTPQGQGQDPLDKDETPRASKQGSENPNDFAAMLLAMEARLVSKLDANNRAVKEAVSLSKLNLSLIHI